MAEAKTNFIINALPDNVDPLERNRLLRSAQIVENQEQLRKCVAILKEQYDEKRLSARLLRLVTKMVLAEKYEEHWKAIYQKIGSDGRQLVLNIKLEPYILTDSYVFKRLSHLYFSLERQCDPERTNKFMQTLVEHMTPDNMKGIIERLKRREIISKLTSDEDINTIVNEYIPSA